MTRPKKTHNTPIKNLYLMTAVAVFDSIDESKIYS